MAAGDNAGLVAIQALDVDLAAEMGRQGKKYVEEQWSWERVIADIEEACGGDPSPTGGNA